MPKPFLCLIASMLLLLSSQAIAAPIPTAGFVVTIQQTVTDVDNPSAVGFTVSPDQSSVDSYELDILRPDGTVLQTLNLGKPAPAADNTCVAPINVQPVKFGIGYSVRIRALAGGAASEYAVSENKFNRVPGPPQKIKIGG